MGYYRAAHVPPARARRLVQSFKREASEHEVQGSSPLQLALAANLPRVRQYPPDCRAPAWVESNAPPPAARQVDRLIGLLLDAGAAAEPATIFSALALGPACSAAACEALLRACPGGRAAMLRATATGDFATGVRVPHLGHRALLSPPARGEPPPPPLPARTLSRCGPSTSRTPSGCGRCTTRC